MSDRDRTAVAFSSLLEVPARLSELEGKLDDALAAIAGIARALPPALVGVREAARALGVSVPTVRRLVKSKRLPAIRIGGSVRIDLSAVRPTKDGDVAILAARARAQLSPSGDR